MSKPGYKPLLYTTTIRNPERYKDFMHILKRYDGKELNDKTIESFECDLFKVGLYRPMLQPASVQWKWASSKSGEFADQPLTDEEAVQIYTMNDPNSNNGIKGHKEAGFPKGWPSRFDTQFKLMKALGFVYYKMNEPIRFSQTGDYLAASVEIVAEDGSVSREVVHPEYEQMAFMQAFAKQQRCNPFIRELNDNIPLILLLQVIKLLDNDPQFNSCGISYKEIPLLLFWKDNDAEALCRRIKQLRSEYGYNPSDEVIQDICVDEILGGFKKFKLKSIVAEYPDDFVRKMRMTGLVSFRGGGRFIDINHNEDCKINYIIGAYSQYEKYQTEMAYFEYMSAVDEKLFSLHAAEMPKTVAAEKLSELVTDYPWETIKTELNNLAKKKASKHDVLRFIAAPARLEFLTALAIKSQLPEVTVIPNYTCDDEGLPTSTARGNVGDIECYERQNGVLVEVTMAEGRQQTVMEVWPIERHLSDFLHKVEPGDAQCIFVAPTIYGDTERQISFVRYDSGLTIRPYRIEDFVGYMEQASGIFRLPLESTRENYR